MIYAAKNKVIDARFGDKKVLKMMLGDVNMYTTEFPVTCDLENVTSDAPVSVLYGNPLSVTLTGNVKETSVVILMGGNDITSTAYDHTTKTITIASVTGDVSVTAVGWPYDAQVEWLETDGNAYINTGVNIVGNTRFNIVMNIPVATESFWLFGGGTSSSTSPYSGQLGVQRGSSKFLWRYGASVINGPNVNTKAKNITFDNKSPSASRTCMIGGSGYVASSQSFSTTNKIVIFGWNENGSVTGSHQGVKLVSAKLYVSNTTLARDYIPVKKDNVGYLYDKVSDTLFGNANSIGAFTYGNDV